MTDKDKIRELLLDLSKEEILEILAGGDTNEDSEQKPKKGRSQSRGKKKEKTGASSGENAQKSKSGRARRVAKRGERPAASTKRGNKRRGGKGKLARIEPVNLNGDRELNTDPWIAQQIKRGHRTKKELEEAAKDKAVWQPQVRRPEVDFFEMECKDCGDIWEVPESRIYRDDDGIVFVCDECVSRRRE